MILGPQNHEKTLKSVVLSTKSWFSRFSLISDPPEREKTLKSAALSTKNQGFHKFLLPALGTKKTLQKYPKMAPKSDPGGLQKPKNED